MSWRLLFIVCLAACSRDARHSTSRLDPAAPVVVVVGDARVIVEVADNREMIQRGLMYRTELAHDAGMLFVMGYERDHAFWMKNTVLPLDIIFITREMSVAGVLHDMAPRSERSRRVGAPSLFVLEVNAGWASKHQVTPGTKVRFENLRL